MEANVFMQASDVGLQLIECKNSKNEASNDSPHTSKNENEQSSANQAPSANPNGKSGKQSEKNENNDEDNGDQDGDKEKKKPLPPDSMSSFIVEKCFACKRLKFKKKGRNRLKKLPLKYETMSVENQKLVKSEMKLDLTLDDNEIRLCFKCFKKMLYRVTQLNMDSLKMSDQLRAKQEAGKEDTKQNSGSFILR